MDDKGKVVGVKDPAQSPEVGVQGHLLEVAGNNSFNLVVATYLPFPNICPDCCQGGHPYNEPWSRNDRYLVEAFFCHDLQRLL